MSTSGIQTLGRIHNHTIYCELNHRGKGQIWVDNSIPAYDWIICISQVIAAGLGILLSIIAIPTNNFTFFIIGFILLIYNPLLYVSGRNIFRTAAWNVGLKRSLFRISIPTALIKSTTYINRLEGYKILERLVGEEENEQNRQAKLLVAQIHNALEGLQF